MKGGKKMQKEYKCMEAKLTAIQTEEVLNKLAKEGWRVICGYSKTFLVLERDKE